MRHYNGPSAWSPGHCWVSSKEGFIYEAHDCPPIEGAEALQTFFMTRETFNRFLREMELYYYLDGEWVET